MCSMKAPCSAYCVNHTIFAGTIPSTPIVRDSIVEVGDRDLQSDNFFLFLCGEMSHTANAVREIYRLHFPHTEQIT